MLKKFIKIQNVGKFRDFSWKNNSQFEKLTLVFGENGRGKTTLTAILRSLSMNKPEYITDRKTITSTNNINVQLLKNDQIYKFNETSHWDKHDKNLEMFDSTFVNENIFSGNNISHDHKKNLYYFVIGAEGVNLANHEKLLRDESKKNIDEIKDSKLKIEELVAWKGTVEEFVNLEKQTKIEEKISKAQQIVTSLKQAKNIQAQSLFSNMEINSFPLSDFKNILLKKLEDVANDAEIHTKKHLSSCLDNKAEPWIAKGLDYINDKKICPFCGQSIAGSELINAYQDYFGQAYSEFKTEIKNINNTIDQYFSQKNLLELQKTFEENNALINDWAEHLKISSPNFDFNLFLNLWNTTFDAYQQAMNRKASQPLDDVVSLSEIEDMSTKIIQVQEMKAKYNEWSDLCNSQVQNFKNSLNTQTLEVKTNHLEILEATKIRFLPSINDACNEYLMLMIEKDKLSHKKNLAKSALNDYTENIFKNYVVSINNYLGNFGTGFKLGEIKSSFQGGSPSTSYALLLDDVAIHLKSFKNVLSDGDKNSLAFAFFLAKLEHDSEIKDKIIVFDDPITSFGFNRKNTTKDEILAVSKKAKQVIILSHDAHFLKMIFDNAYQKSSTFCLSRDGRKYSKLEKWDIAEATEGDYFRSYKELTHFLNNGTGDMRTIAKSIRPLLEGNLRFRFPLEFKANEWLGEFITKIDKANKNSAIISLKDKLSEIKSINNYSQKFHHKQNQNADSVSINETELISFVERTLQIISS